MRFLPVSGRSRIAFWGGTCGRIVAAVALLAAFASAQGVRGEGTDWLPIKDGEKIVIIGNTLAERMQHDDFFEPAVQSRFPAKRLVFRNLGWSADEIDLRPRSANFDEHSHRLTDHRPTILIAMFGLNESFAGTEGLESFRQRFAKFITQTREEIGPEAKMVVCSPIPHEDLQRPELPDGSATNANLKLYMEVMREESEKGGVRYVDLFGPLSAAMASSSRPLTINGIHLNRRGYEVLGGVLDVSLFGPRPADVAADMQALVAAVAEKNLQFFYDHRAVNGYYIYGGRKNPYGVVNFPEEFAKLRKMVAVRDQRIWDIAQGKPVPEKIDDSQTGGLSTIETNYAGKVKLLTPEESREQFVLTDGFEIELVVSERQFPEMTKPVALDIDARGRLWVTTNPSYPQYLPGTPPDDKILIYEDVDGDGRADKQTIFADKLHLPIGIALGDGGAYVSQQPDLMFLKDNDGDDVADSRDRILHGFDTADSHHSISAFTFGPDGALYFQEGTFHHTQVETPRGPQRVRDAAVFRYEPKTEKLSVFVSYNFANPWGHCFDRWGQNFIADASPGANYFAAAFSGDVIYPQKHRQMKQFLVKQWRPTAGCVIVGNRHFPESMQGNYLINNTIGFLGTLNYQMSDEGSGFKGSPIEPLLSSKDTNYRPIDMKFGPDGALYIVDWYNPLIGHMQHNLRDPNRDKSHGRIWRVRYRERPLAKPPVIEGAPIDHVVSLLEQYDDTVRHLARMELRQRETDQVVAAIDAWLQRQVGEGSDVEHRRLEALWVMQQHDKVRPELLRQVLDSRDPRARAAGTRVLSYWRDRIYQSTPWLIALAGDESPRVRLEAVRAASFYADAEEGRRIVAAAVDKPLDDYLNYVITETNTTLDRRAPSGSEGDDRLVRQIAAGEVADSQIVPMVTAATRQAKGPQLGRLADAVLRGKYSAASRAEALEPIVIAAKGATSQSTIDVDAAIGRLNEARIAGDSALIERIAELAGEWDIKELTFPLRDVARDPKTPGAAVDASLEALMRFNTPSAGDTRGQFVRDELPAELRLRFAAAAAKSSPPQAAKAVAMAIESGVEPRHGDLLVRATQAILAQPKGLGAVNEALATSRPDADTAKRLLRGLFAADVREGDLVNRLRQAAGIEGGSEPLTPTERQELVRKIDAEGDSSRGQAIYRRGELNCIQCHAISGAGGNVGPDLSGIGANSPTEYLLESILTPSSSIKEAYLTRQVLTSDGVVVRGVQIDRDDQRLILRNETGKEVVIPIDEIEQESEGKSLMPEGLHHLLTRDELVDLVSFLSVLGKPGDFAVNTRPTINRFDVAGDKDVDWAKVDDADLVAKSSGLPETSWQSVYSLVDGTIPGDDVVTAAATNGSILLRGTIDVVVAGTLAVRLNGTQPQRVVISGKRVDGSDGVELAPGRYPVHIVLAPGFDAKGMAVELIKPSGSPIQFTIGGVK